MKLTKDEERALLEAAKLFKSTQHIKKLSAGQFSKNLLSFLMRSDTHDLARTGCYLTSRIDNNADLSFLETHRISSLNYARFLLSEYSIKQIEAGKYSSGTISHAKDLEAVKPQPAQASSPTSYTYFTPHKPKNLTIIVHGTFAATDDWWQKPGDFWQYINSKISDLYSKNDPFCWSGGNSHSARVKAAQALVTWAGMNPCNRLRIIAHSHGGNVCFLATRMGLRIDELITLGTPIRLEYLPDLKNIRFLHNVFSTADLIQTPAGTIPNKRGEGRTLGETERVLNHIATDDGSGANPGHGELHDPDTWEASEIYKLL